MADIFSKEFKTLLNDLNKKIAIYRVSASKDDYDIKKSKKHNFVIKYSTKPINRGRFDQLIVAALAK
jgi:hypothetical protein